MYVICYGKSPKALEAGSKLIKDIGGRYVTGTELLTVGWLKIFLGGS